MGWGYFRLGQFTQSVEFLQRAYAQVQDVEIAAHLGEALWMSGDKQAAQKIWTESLRENPDNAPLKALMKRYLP
jgi:tetratricopeptide (TPR) repeat protein